MQFVHDNRQLQTITTAPMPAAGCVTQQATYANIQQTEAISKLHKSTNQMKQVYCFVTTPCVHVESDCTGGAATASQLSAATAAVLLCNHHTLHDDVSTHYHVLPCFHTASLSISLAGALSDSLSGTTLPRLLGYYICNLLGSTIMVTMAGCGCC
jgi:hypothetical protein